MLNATKLFCVAIATASVVVMYAQEGPQAAAASDAKTTVLLQQGQSQLQEQDYRGAITTFTEAVRLSPRSAEPYFHRGLVRFELEDELGALEDFDDAVQRNPQFAKAYLYRGSVLLSLGDQSNGLLDLRQAAELFDAQGDKTGYQRSISLIKHFNPVLAP